MLIDEYFAKQCALLAETGDEDFLSFCEYIMKSCREGHIACKILEEVSFPKAEEQEKVYRGSRQSHPAVITDIEGATFSTPIGRMCSLFYVKRRFDEETAVIQYLEKQLSKETSWPLNEELISKSINAKQREAIEQAAASPFLIISGGPGRGKTFVAKEILKQFFLSHPDASVIASAPTGKAASRYASIPNVTTKTLHRLLGIREGEEEGKEIISSDLLIIDECSMIDLPLWALLMKALSPHTRLILIGDPHQLPPIETGTFFRDLCSIENIPHVKLEECLRSDNRHILELSDAVFSENYSTLATAISPLPEREHFISSCIPHFPEPKDTLPSLDTLPSFVILSSLRKGPFGSLALNEEIEKILLSKGKLWTPIPILITENSYSLELYNGELGILLRHRYDRKLDTAYFNQKAYSPAILPPFEKAWAISVHKSQGSEYDHVYFLLAEGSESFGKEMIYTAITRAKKSITLFSKKEIFFQCLTEKTEKYGFLQERLCNVTH